jgi:hypothetical protein
MRPIGKSSVWVLTLAVSMAACGGGTTTKPVPVTSKGLTLAIMPVEGDVFPKLVKAVNGALQDARIGGVQRSFVSKVSLEVVQISIECVDASAACWSAVGKSLNSDRILFAQIDPIIEKKKKSVRLRVTMFDVRKGETVGDTYHTFSTEDEAVAGSRGVITETLNAATPPADVTEAPTK